MSEGNASRSPVRYQDYCAMYFALDHFKNNESFEKIYCEQGKNDFEIWNASEFIGFQVKTNPLNLTAKEVNKIFRYYNSKSVVTAKDAKSFFFIFTTQPTRGLGNLFAIIRDGYGGSVYGKRIQTFINTALEDIPFDTFTIRFYCYNEIEIQRLVFSLSMEILREKTGDSQAVDDELTYNFIGRLRNEIDTVSCKEDDNERVFTNSEIQELIGRFINSYKKEEITNVGSRTQRKIVVELPKIPYDQVVTRQFTVTETLRIIKEDGEGTLT